MHKSGVSALEAAERQIVEALGSTEFRSLWRRMEQHWVSWEEFEGLTMPAGLAREQVWRIANTIRSHGAKDMPFPPYLVEDAGERLWYTSTTKLQESLRRISERSFRNSQLSCDLAKRAKSSAIARLMAPEMAAVLRQDGLCIDVERARKLAAHKPPPPHSRRARLPPLRRILRKPAGTDRDARADRASLRNALGGWSREGRTPSPLRHIQPVSLHKRLRARPRMRDAPRERSRNGGTPPRAPGHAVRDNAAEPSSPACPERMRGFSAACDVFQGVELSGARIPGVLRSSPTLSRGNLRQRALPPPHPARSRSHSKRGTRIRLHRRPGIHPKRVRNRIGPPRKVHAFARISRKRF